jgi:transcriptional regulator with XRE-family HTH domain
MESINARVKQLRKELKMSQEEFGKRLNITKSGVCDIESGRRNVQESHIVMIKNNIKEKNINENWLRTGEGNMFKENPLGTLLAEISFGDDEFIKDFIEVYISLDDCSKKALQEIMNRMYEKSKARKGD